MSPQPQTRAWILVRALQRITATDTHQGLESRGRGGLDTSVTPPPMFGGKPTVIGPAGFCIGLPRCSSLALTVRPHETPLTQRWEVVVLIELVSSSQHGRIESHCD